MNFSNIGQAAVTSLRIANMDTIEVHKQMDLSILNHGQTGEIKGLLHRAEHQMLHGKAI